MPRKIICAFLAGLGILYAFQAFAATDNEGFIMPAPKQQAVEEDTGIWRWGTFGTLINQSRWKEVAFRPRLTIPAPPKGRPGPKPKLDAQPVAKP
jgi:hypothetical protein